MSKSKVEGTKIAQAAKDLNVTSVTIRRYLAEFNIETATDENGIKVLPKHAMDELQEVRRLKEDGMTNPKVLEHLEDHRKFRKAEAKDKSAKSKDKDKEKEKDKEKPRVTSRATTRKVVEVEPEEDEEEVPPAAQEKERKRPSKAKPAPQEDADSEVEPATAESEAAEGDGDVDLASGDTRLKHSLTCQTCGKTFEHLNPRLRDCLDCYRAKRKERRRGGSDRHKNVIQHPLAQQVASKAQANQVAQPRDAEAPAVAARESHRDRDRPERGDRDRGRDRDRDRDSGRDGGREVREVAAREPAPAAVAMVPPASVQRPVRSYRKAIEETRVITGSLKRRLERPDLPEGERRWLEQIYAYQLILHQGWRHLAEYKATSQQQGGGGASASKSSED